VIRHHLGKKEIGARRERPNWGLAYRSRIKRRMPQSGDLLQPEGSASRHRAIYFMWQDATKPFLRTFFSPSPTNHIMARDAGSGLRPSHH
jgi:hypothetical protein